MTVHYNPLYQDPNANGPFVPATITNPNTAQDAHPRVLTRMQSRQHGQAVLSRLAVGDQSALTESGLVAPRTGYDTQVHEWGLGFDPNQQAYYLVSGGPSMVDWAGQTLVGLQSVAHTHPMHPIDRAQVIANLAPTVSGALIAWRATFGTMPIGNMPGDFWYLFPSNQDVGAAYYTSHQNTEVVYAPYRLGTDSWLATDKGPTIAVEYGPVTATLKPDSEKTVRTLKLDVKTPEGMKATEELCLQYLWAPITFSAGTTVLDAGWMQVDPLQGVGGRSPNSAWFKSQGPTTSLTRAQVHQFILNAARA